jgi:radical SAM protein with 4Fe4S-binding SPASM domain
MIYENDDKQDFQDYFNRLNECCKGCLVSPACQIGCPNFILTAVTWYNEYDKRRNKIFKEEEDKESF